MKKSESSNTKNKKSIQVKPKTQATLTSQEPKLCSRLKLTADEASGK